MTKDELKRVLESRGFTVQCIGCNSGKMIVSKKYKQGLFLMTITRASDSRTATIKFNNEVMANDFTSHLDIHNYIVEDYDNYLDSPT